MLIYILHAHAQICVGLDRKERCGRLNLMRGSVPSPLLSLASSCQEAVQTPVRQPGLLPVTPVVSIAGDLHTNTNSLEMRRMVVGRCAATDMRRAWIQRQPRPAPPITPCLAWACCCCWVAAGRQAAFSNDHIELRGRCLRPSDCISIKNHDWRAAEVFVKSMDWAWTPSTPGIAPFKASSTPFDLKLAIT